MDQVGIPHEVARIHTKPEIVTKFNIDWLTDLVNSGKANFLLGSKRRKDENGVDIFDPDAPKVRINLQYALYKRGTELLYGDIIVKNHVVLSENKNGGIKIPKKYKEGADYIHVEKCTEKIRPGDKLIRNGKLIDYVGKTKNKITLRVGDVVERQLQPDDWVVENRQPWD